MEILYVKPGIGEKEKVEQGFPEHSFIFTDDIASISDEICEKIDVISVFVNAPLDATTLTRFSSLKLIAARSTGFDHIDKAQADKMGATIVHVPRYGSQTVAEYTFTLMFALARNAFVAYADMQFTSEVKDLDQYEGCNLTGKNIGVIGTGLIGQRVCTIAKCLGMNVLAYDPYPNEALRSSVTYVDLDTLLSQADFVTIHVPANPHTYHLLNAEKIALLKQSAYLINTARGEIVDTHALVVALQEKRIRGAALDVLEGERYLREESRLSPEEKNDSVIQQLLEDNHALIAMKEAIVTPHIAFDTKEAKEEITQTTIANIKAFAEGKIINEIPA